MLITYIHRKEILQAIPDPMCLLIMLALFAMRPKVLMVVPLEVVRISTLVKGIFQRMVETMAPMVPLPPIWEWAAVERGAQPVEKNLFWAGTTGPNAPSGGNKGQAGGDRGVLLPFGIGLQGQIVN